MANPYLSGNFAPVHEERSTGELPVTGVLPPDLEGRLLRNGPNPFSVPADPADYDWFAGDGMVHAISLSGGKATGYRNRWVRTRALAAKAGFTPPRGPLEPVDSQANTNVIRHAGRTLALMESGFPHRLSSDLDRAQVYDFDGTLASPMCAHPKHDPATGELVFFGVDLFGPPFLRYHVVDAGGQLVATEDLEIPRAAMMHDFGLTTTRAVLFDQPVLFDLALASSGRSVPFRWSPVTGSRVGILPREGRAADLQWIDTDPSFVFHVLNAFDDGDAVVMDVIRYETAFDTEPGGAFSRSSPSLWRWTVDPTVGRVSEVRVDDTPVEFPRIDEAFAGRRHRYGYCTMTGNLPDQPSWEGLVKYDFQRDESTRFDPGPHRSASEAIFVRAADGAGEDEGWVLTVVYDATRDASDVVVLDATSFGGPPVATVHLPARVPFGFHGSWMPASP